MELKDWIKRCLNQFSTILITETTGGYKHPFKAIQEYDAAVKLCGEHSFLTCATEFYADIPFIYYMCWDNGTGYLFTVYSSRTTYTKAEYYFQFDVLGSGVNWKRIVNNKWPGLLNGCVGCKCYNDKLITGECCIDSIKEVTLWN